MPLPDRPDDELPTLCDVVDALVTIQAHTTTQPRLPEIDELSRHADPYLLAARVLNGEKVTRRWHSHRAHLPPGAQLPAGEPEPWTIIDPLTVIWNGTALLLGERCTHLPSPRVGPGAPVVHEDHVDVLPAGDDAAVMHLVRGDDDCVCGQVAGRV
jgi:hypothetical protein